MSGDLARRITTAVREAAESGTGAAIATAIHSVRPDDLAEFFHASLAEDVDADPITSGLPASPGAAAGRIVLTAEAAMEAGDRGEDVILLRPRAVVILAGTNDLAGNTGPTTLFAIQDNLASMADWLGLDDGVVESVPA